MKVFVVSDIHGNIGALGAVLENYRREYPCDFLFLGDAVGYGAHPDSCLDAILDIPRAKIVLGNHDAALLKEMRPPEMNEVAAEAISWTERRLDDRYLEAIRRRFRLSVEGESYIGVHGSPRNPEDWQYVLSPIEAGQAFSTREFRVCFVGHTHVPSVFSFNQGELTLENGAPLALEARDRFIINPGSVGQPRDGDPRAAFLLFDTDAGTVTLRRCEYDIEAQARDIIDAGLPAILADRLYLGA